MKHNPMVRIAVPQLYVENDGVLSAGIITADVTLTINGKKITRSTIIHGKVGAPGTEPTFDNTYFRELDFSEETA